MARNAKRSRRQKKVKTTADGEPVAWTGSLWAEAYARDPAGNRMSITGFCTMCSLHQFKKTTPATDKVSNRLTRLRHRLALPSRYARTLVGRAAVGAVVAAAGLMLVSAGSARAAGPQQWQEMPTTSASHGNMTDRPSAGATADASDVQLASLTLAPTRTTSANVHDAQATKATAGPSALWQQLVPFLPDGRRPLDTPVLLNHELEPARTLVPDTAVFAVASDEFDETLPESLLTVVPLPPQLWGVGAMLTLLLGAIVLRK